MSAGLIDATVLSSADGPLASNYEAIGVPVVIAQSPLEKVDQLRDYRHVLNSLGRQLKLEDFDLVYANTLESFHMVDCADQWGVPALWNIHESQSWQTCFQDLPPPVAKQARRCFEKAHRVVFVSQKTQALFSSLNTQDNFITINNGIKLEDIEQSCLDWSRPEARTALGVSENEVCLLTVGAVCERKNQHELIQALRSLPESLHSQLRCYIVGARPSFYSQQLAQEIEALPETLQDRVVMVDETSDTARFYRAADVFVCNSRFESYPRVILEAMAYGLPIVTTPVFGIQEQVRNNINGVYYEPGDVHALIQHLTRCVEDPQWRKQLADQSKPTLDSLTNFEQMITAYQSLIKEASAESANASTRRLPTGA